ncbi:hypothetical protein AGDE_01686 [Angomonas deanei]|uniref:Zinc knuckle, putative n=1 Tax=Angomonas deanei TaxID=59799 RepID=S9VHI7_9TRYP|nr:hypothetical protein AGDE_10609 [Angomonas deanei]EPY41580.1 hypothetical protein AGDE_02344 [Angomonas deanei]EPY42237.1 hypothetical protein AGDE_01686 [Angomonas deanei]CAD2216732.1 Zinc knuckle, putative [Angomonas deanei]|eukprot:EPY27984.1 hypothetical protein AGDE_10609 [Angomonas deanei]
MQLYFTAIQWKLRSANRRSGLSYALKNLAGVERKESDSAVQSAMTVGNRPVWDVRPLPYHFLEYAASDVRYIQLLYERVTAADFPYADKLDVAAVKRVSQCYVEHYGTGTTVQQELDDKPVEVNPLILERYLGPGGVCRFCGGKGHTEAECFKKQKRNTVVCSFCGQKGHIEANCFKKHPEHNKCSLCGQVGHKASNCFKASPCKHCGGFHRSENCIHTHKKQSPASGKT